MRAVKLEPMVKPQVEVTQFFYYQRTRNAPIKNLSVSNYVVKEKAQISSVLFASNGACLRKCLFTIVVGISSKSVNFLLSLWIILHNDDGVRIGLLD